VFGPAYKPPPHASPFAYGFDDDPEPLAADPLDDELVDEERALAEAALAALLAQPVRLLVPDTESDAPAATGPSGTIALCSWVANVCNCPDWELDGLASVSETAVR
jgi:hypothetical protein